jgi:hypothetical protein
MGGETPVRSRHDPPAEATQQCLVRDANELTERANDALPVGTIRLGLRCECGDPACRTHVYPTHAAYEDVRESSSRFVVGRNHENPESACLVVERPGYSVIDVIDGAARHAVRARGTRHAFVEGPV